MPVQNTGIPDNQNKVSWLVSGIPSRAPINFSCSIWVLDTLGQALENSSMEMNSRPCRASTMAMAADSPKPGQAVKGGIRALCSLSTKTGWRHL